MNTSLSKLIDEAIKEALTAEKNETKNTEYNESAHKIGCNVEMSTFFDFLLGMGEENGEDEEDLDELGQSILALHIRPIFVISSIKFDKLSDAIEQLEDWFIDGTLDPLSAIYKCSDEYGNEYYTISSTEFDDVADAFTQLGVWFIDGKLDKKANLHESRLHNTYEPTITVKRVSMFENESEEC